MMVAVKDAQDFNFTMQGVTKNGELLNADLKGFLYPVHNYIKKSSEPKANTCKDIVNRIQSQASRAR